MSVSSVKPPAPAPTPTPTPNVLTQGSTPVRASGSDGDTAAQEALENRGTNQAERANGGFAPKPNTANKVDKTA
jgi:hypothetical protein